MRVHKHFARGVKIRMAVMDINQKELGKLLGYRTSNSVHRICREDYEGLTIKSMIRVCKALDTDIGEILQSGKEACDKFENVKEKQ